MNNYYKFTKLKYVKETIEFFNNMSTNELNTTLDNTFNDIDNYLNFYANFLKNIFNGQDYDECYYDMKVLSEELNNIKIILNILKGRKYHE